MSMSHPSLANRIAIGLEWLLVPISMLAAERNSVRIDNDVQVKASKISAEFRS